MILAAPRAVVTLIVAVCLTALGASHAVLAADRHVGYYYPEPATTEVYRARADVLPDSDRRRRILFITELTNQMMMNSYPPPFAIFQKVARQKN